MRTILSAGLTSILALAAPLDAQTNDRALRLVVNIPAGRLYLYEGGTAVKSYPVSVGRPAHRTPTGSYVVRHAIWNPDWTPPDAEWAKDRHHAAPGPRNPMGRVKIQLSGDYYIHGTVSENNPLLGRPASHGCVRMSNADVTDLARRLHAYASPDVDSAELARIAASLQTRWVPLARTVPVEIAYRVVEVADGRLVVHPDVYGQVRDLRTEIRAALAGAGFDPGTLGGAVVAVAEREFRQSGHATVALAGLRGRHAPDLELASTLAALD